MTTNKKLDTYALDDVTMHYAKIHHLNLLIQYDRT
jgi:hypothetical protein